MNVPQMPKFDLLELSWWEYPHIWIGFGIVALLLIFAGAYWWWLRLGKKRLPKTPVELLYLQLTELEQSAAVVPQTYQEQKRYYEQLSCLLHGYVSICDAALRTELTDVECIGWLLEHLKENGLMQQCEAVVLHGQQVKFAGQMLDPHLVCSEVNFIINLVRKELERCR